MSCSSPNQRTLWIMPRVHFLLLNEVSLIEQVDTKLISKINEIWQAMKVLVLENLGHKRTVFLSHLRMYIWILSGESSGWFH